MRVVIAGIVCVAFSACASSSAQTQDLPDEPAPAVIVDEDATALEPYQVAIEDAIVEVDMIPVPPGSIAVEGEQVDVGPFWISRTEIPWDIFDVYAFGSTDGDEAEGEDAVLRPSKPYGAPDRGYGHRGYAAISMSYIVAEEFAQWLSLRTGDEYRVPTEAEWEFACRAGRTEPLAAEELEKHAWYWDNAFDKTHPIAELEPNEFGLHDMIGNAAEWCTGLDGEPLACGGSFMNKIEEVGCSARMEPSPKWQETDPQIPKSEFWLTDGPFMGFRVIRVPE